MKKQKPKQKFKHGVAPVPGVPGKWDINYQVKGKRVTERIDAVCFEDAVAYRMDKKKQLRTPKERPLNEEPAFDLMGIYKELMNHIEEQVRLGNMDRKSISGISTRFKRFFFDYPKHLGVVWKTTADFTAENFKNYETYYGLTLGRLQGRSSEMRTLKRVFSHLKEKKWISNEKLTDLRAVKCRPKNFTKLIPNPDEDFNRVLSWFKEHDIRSYDFFYFLRRLGRRPKEVRQLLREDVNLEAEYIFVPKEIAKNRKDGYLPTSDQDVMKTVVRAVDFSRKLNSKFLFLNKYGRPFSASNPLVAFKAAAKACGIDNWRQWTVYQLKKCMITQGFSADLTPEKIQILTGHMNLGSEKGHYYQADLNVAREVFEATKPRGNHDKR